MICYMLGSNPPQIVMEGYFQRIQGTLGIDKIGQINKGVFIVRFHNAEHRNQVVEEHTFDRKPVVVKPWRQDMEYNKESTERIPVWVRLMALDIKYQGKLL